MNRGVRLLGSHALDYIKKRIVVTAEFDSRDESYSWILVVHSLLFSFFIS